MKPPKPPPGKGDSPVCPECGDEAFFFDNAEDFGFSCDSCPYIIFASDHPQHRGRLIKLALDMGMR